MDADPRVTTLGARDDEAGSGAVEDGAPPVVGPLGCPGDLSWVDNVGGDEDASGGHANCVGAEDLGVVERDEQVLLVGVTPLCPAAVAVPG